MDSETWPAYLRERAARHPPSDCGIVPGSTPVVSFGHPLAPTVATLGINPSSGEFVGPDGSLLAGGARRLSTLASLGVDDYGSIGQAEAAQVIDDCASYFGRKPYKWFTPLDRILKDALGVSYFNGTACHLDLVQWATKPLWGKLDEVARARLLADDRPFLVQQLHREHYQVVLVNGRTGLQWTQRAGLTRWQAVKHLAGPPTATLYVGDTLAPRFIGWSCNLQSQPGAMRHAPEITELVRQRGKEALHRPVEPQEKVESGIARGTHARTGSEFIALLSSWVVNSEDETIGDVTRFPRAPWLSVETPLGLMDLNADTRRPAVIAFIDHARRDGRAYDLHAVANRNGRINKVVFDPSAPAPVGWYAYLRHEASAPGAMNLP